MAPRPKRKWKHWTKAEDAVLFLYAGRASEMQLRCHLPGRGWEGIRARAEKLGYSLTAGSYSLEELIRETGFNWEHFCAARDALGMTWATLRMRKKHPRYLISEEQRAQLLAYLTRPPKYVTKEGHQSDRWSRKYERCQRCGTDGNKPGQRHNAKGYCASCYNTLYVNPKSSIQKRRINEVAALQRSAPARVQGPQRDARRRDQQPAQGRPGGARPGA